MTYRLFLLLGLFLIPQITSAGDSYSQEFVITAYYSPLPGQCCYATGGYESDIRLNGQGLVAADSTAVYPGMAAAPSSYAFGTIISLPGLGVVKVHDRGQAIIEKDNGKHRLDLWVGTGEEGLARALAFGVKRVTGTVYPVGIQAPQVQMELASLMSPASALNEYFVAGKYLTNVSARFGDRGKTVELLQSHLRDLGYFSHAITGYFGPVTRTALRAFIESFGLQVSADDLTSEVGAAISAAHIRREASFPITQYVDRSSSPSAVSSAKRVLRFLGLYRGRTNGEYDDLLRQSILDYQLERGIVSSPGRTGAGRIGPQTLRSLASDWNRKISLKRAERLLLTQEIDERLKSDGKDISRFLGVGHSGREVRLLQALLTDLGFFPEGKANGHFGPQTQASVLAYQIDRGIVSSSSDTGAGYVGPQTLVSLRADQRKQLVLTVRGEGWDAL